MKRLLILVLTFIILSVVSIHGEPKTDIQSIEKMEVHIHYSGDWIMQYGHIRNDEPLETFNGRGDTYYNIDVNEYSADVGIIAYKMDSSQELLVILLLITKNDIIETYSVMTYDSMVGLSYMINIVKETGIKI